MLVGCSSYQQRSGGAHDSPGVIGESHGGATDCGREELTGNDGEAAEIACSPEAHDWAKP